MAAEKIVLCDHMHRISFAAFRRATLIALVPWCRDFQNSKLFDNYSVFKPTRKIAAHVANIALSLKETLLFQQIANITCILIFTTKVKK